MEKTILLIPTVLYMDNSCVFVCFFPHLAAYSFSLKHMNFVQIKIRLIASYLCYLNIG